MTQYDCDEEFFCFGANGMVSFQGKHKSAFVRNMAMIYVVRVHIVMQQTNVAIEILLLFIVIFILKVCYKPCIHISLVSLAYVEVVKGGKDLLKTKGLKIF